MVNSSLCLDDGASGHNRLVEELATNRLGEMLPGGRQPMS